MCGCRRRAVGGCAAVPGDLPAPDTAILAPGPGSRAPTGRGRVTGIERGGRTAHRSPVADEAPKPFSRWDETLPTCPRRTVMAIYEYPPGAAFPGVIGRTTDESSPAS